MSEYLYRCPFCNRDQAVTGKDRHTTFSDLTLDNADGPRRLVVKFVVCPDPACRRFSLSASLHGLKQSGGRSYTGQLQKTWDLVPPSRARSFPAAIPPRILEDYEEACLTLEISQKVAAALARRCLSEMMRDFWQVQPGRLIDEIRQIKGAADPLTWEAIESVRNSGMIGARFESEGAEIFDVDPGEANLLIGLIETLVEDWYVGREQRKKRLQGIRRIAGEPAAEQVTEEPGTTE